jgi:hypothetical protein
MGTLPSNLGASITSLNFSGLPSIHGTLVNFSQLTMLESIVLNSGVSGTLPRDLNALTALTTLQFYNGLLGDMISSKISGTFPSSYSKLQSLSSLVISKTDCSGTIPSEYGLFSSLTLLQFAQNLRLSGSTPSTFSKLSVLTIFSIEASGVSDLLFEDSGLCILKNLRQCSLAIIGCPLPNRCGPENNVCIFDRVCLAPSASPISAPSNPESENVHEGLFVLSTSVIICVFILLGSFIFRCNQSSPCARRSASAAVCRYISLLIYIFTCLFSCLFINYLLIYLFYFAAVSLLKPNVSLNVHSFCL